ncbi:MAG: polyribonucleotide nucleotidyltransferase, partial [Candidatus Liptonbacteria bacterium]|nr:polyribonucleotide nucleotidyltransferase [Candidatus Liptonbacteria bacterium]
DIPWNGPAAGVRVAKIGNDFVVNPSNALLKAEGVALETFVAGTEDRLSMIELGGNEAKEEDVLAAFERAQSEIARLTRFLGDIIREAGKPKAALTFAEPDAALRASVEAYLAPRLEDALYKGPSLSQYARLHALKVELLAHLTDSAPEGGEGPDERAVGALFEEAVERAVTENILKKERRPDGRKLDAVRPLAATVALFARTHGSALFARGNTQALAVTTLAPPGQEQLVETMELTAKRRFMLHYNFPSYSVGEIGAFRGPGRREIGHGALAEKALRAVIPAMADFPYTIRVVSEILSSNGSSSMATVCASALSLMDAGVPIRKPVAGIAMGLVSGADGAYKVLTDIQGPEDHYGDMDCKVAGTDAGVTAIQMDVKIRGLTLAMIQETLAHARDARREILQFMAGVLSAPRAALSKYAPIIRMISINPERIGEVIGSGGKVINGLIKKTGVSAIDIEEDGRIYVASDDPKKAEEAIRAIEALVREFAVGEVVEGSVIKILDFGAIVDLGGGRDGMVHVSELRNGYVKDVHEVVKMGDFVRAKVIRVDADGKIGLSLKQLEK